MSMDLQTANKIILTALQIRRERKLKPLTVCVVDEFGHVISAQRENDSALLRFEIAFGKAWGCLSIRHSTRFYEDVLVKNRPYFANSLEAASHGKFITVYGGVMIRTQDGELVGAIGVTGDTGENDEKIAVAALEACGLRPDLS
jgi:uncharacterized protein GlcG (DUF336 family)